MDGQSKSPLSPGNCPMRSSMKMGLGVHHLLLQECGWVTSVGGPEIQDRFLFHFHQGRYACYTNWLEASSIGYFLNLTKQVHGKCHSLVCAIKEPCTFPWSTIYKNLSPGLSSSRLATLPRIFQTPLSKKKKRERERRGTQKTFLLGQWRMNETALLTLATHFYPFWISSFN